MSRKARLFELMMKREKLASRQKAEALGGLVDDQSKLTDLDEKLAVLLELNTRKSGPQSVSALKSKAFYGREMAQQREFTQNKLSFLETEIETAQALLSQSMQKKKILQDRVQVEKRLFLQEAEERSELVRPERRNTLKA